MPIPQERKVISLREEKTRSYADRLLITTILSTNLENR
jgi:hypothetical protein